MSTNQIGLKMEVSEILQIQLILLRSLKLHRIILGPVHHCLLCTLRQQISMDRQLGLRQMQSYQCQQTHHTLQTLMLPSIRLLSVVQVSITHKMEYLQLIVQHLQAHLVRNINWYLQQQPQTHLNLPIRNIWKHKIITQTPPVLQQTLMLTSNSENVKLVNLSHQTERNYYLIFTIFNSCTSCPAGTSYSLSQMKEPGNCKSCPTGTAVCYGGSHIGP